MSSLPAWAPWALWPLVVALLCGATVELPKWWLFKRSGAPLWRVWSRQTTAGKARLLGLLLAPAGALYGWALYGRAGLEDDPLLALALGAATGVLTPPLRDFAFWLPSFAQRALKVKAGVTEATTTMPTVEPADPDRVATIDGSTWPSDTLDVPAVEWEDE